jgi:futalosine hydrolase
MVQQLSKNGDICSLIVCMNCLLIAATAKEIAPFLMHYRNTQKQFSANTDIDVLVTGIGLTATSYHLTRQLQLKRPDFVIQAGVAGCFDNQLPLGSVIAIGQDTIADESVIEMKKLKTLFDLKLVPQDQFPFTKGWLVNNTDLLKKSKLKIAKGISVNQITTSKEMIRFYKKEFNPVTESMEGAALHYVCLNEQIPFLQIRSVSNYIGERNKKNWNMNDSIANLNYELISIIEKI